MIINFLGDSITWGAGAKTEENRFVNRVGKALNCTVRNYGIGGTRIARQTVTHCTTEFDQDYLLRAPLMEDDADYVFVFGGTNDFGHGDAEIGTMDSTDPCTFYGAIKLLIEMLTEKYGKEKLAFILPMPRHNQDNPRGEGYKTKDFATLQGYVDVLIEVLDAYKIPYIDLFYHSVLPKPVNNKPDDYFSDGLHPNDFGHLVIAQAVVAFVEKMEFDKKNK